MMPATYITLALVVALPATVALIVLTWVAQHIGWTRTLAALVAATLVILAWLTGLHWLVEWSGNFTL